MVDSNDGLIVALLDWSDLFPNVSDAFGNHFLLILLSTILEMPLLIMRYARYPIDIQHAFSIARHPQLAQQQQQQQRD